MGLFDLLVGSSTPKTKSYYAKEIASATEHLSTLQSFLTSAKIMKNKHQIELQKGAIAQQKAKIAALKAKMAAAPKG